MPDAQTEDVRFYQAVREEITRGGLHLRIVSGAPDYGKLTIRRFWTVGQVAGDVRQRGFGREADQLPGAPDYLGEAIAKLEREYPSHPLSEAEALELIESAGRFGSTAAAILAICVTKSGATVHALYFIPTISFADAVALLVRYKPGAEFPVTIN